MPLESLYANLIQEHAKHMHHSGLREPFDAEVQHLNPVCGDKVTLRVTLKEVGGEPVIGDLSYDCGRLPRSARLACRS